jgi:hypothetical protein
MEPTTLHPLSTYLYFATLSSRTHRPSAHRAIITRSPISISLCTMARTQTLAVLLVLLAVIHLQCSGNGDRCWAKQGLPAVRRAGWRTGCSSHRKPHTTSDA